MPEPRHLTNAPIREAAIDVQISPPVSLDVLQTINGRIKDKLHKRGEVWQASIGLDLDKDGSGTANAERTPIGYRYDFTDSPYVLQCRVNGFTFSRLPPYETWEKLSATARELWEIYLETTKPQTVSRIAVRYINGLQLPLPIADFAEYLNVSPEIPAGLPQTLASFLQRFVIVDDSSECAAVVTQVLEEQQTQLNKITILLDIDVFKTFSALAPNTDDVWATLEKLRDFKNRIFFKYVTEKTLGIFE